MPTLFIWSLLLILIYFSVLFVFAQIKKNNSIVDLFWGLGFVVVAWFDFIVTWIELQTFYRLLLV